MIKQIKGSATNADSLLRSDYGTWATRSLTWSIHASDAAYAGKVVYYADTAGQYPLYADVFDPAGLNLQAQNIASLAFLSIASFSGMNITRASPGAPADINFGTFTSTYTISNNSGGYASPGASASSKFVGTPPTQQTFVASGDIWLTAASGATQNPTTAISYTKYVIKHEIAHLLGLGHGNEVLSLSPTERDQRFSITSYTTFLPNNNFVSEYQLYDIASIQSRYGRATAIAQGPNEYRASFFSNSSAPTDAFSNRYFSLWDADGDDTIDLSDILNANSSGFVDLRPGSFSSIGVGTGVRINSVVSDSRSLSDAGIQNVSIAFGAFMENVIGTKAADVIVGNILSNNLKGGDGDDIIYGSGSAIRNVAQAGVSIGVLSTDDGEYGVFDFWGYQAGKTINETFSIDVIDGGGGNDFLTAGHGSDKLYGGVGNDLLRGGEGKNLIHGGGPDASFQNDGFDKASYAGRGAITITVGGAAVDQTYRSESGFSKAVFVESSSTIDTLLSIERINGSSLNDRLVINHLDANILAAKSSAPGGLIEIDLSGGASTNGFGGDLLDMSSMKEAARLAADGLLFTVSARNQQTRWLHVYNAEEVNGTAYNDHFDFSKTSLSGLKIDAGSGDDLVIGGSGADMINGGSGKNTLRGEAGNDKIYDEAGRSTESLLYGGSGDDLLVGGRVLSGGTGNDTIDARSMVTDEGSKGWSHSGAEGSVVRFSRGDGVDQILSDHGKALNIFKDSSFFHGYTPGSYDRYHSSSGVRYIELGDISRSDIKVKFNAVTTEQIKGDYYYYSGGGYKNQMLGDLALERIPISLDHSRRS